MLWSLIEVDFWKDDEPSYEREFSVDLGANGVGTFTGNFFMFARNGKVCGIDESTGESPTDSMYVLLEKSNGDDINTSQTFTASVG